MHMVHKGVKWSHAGGRGTQKMIKKSELKLRKETKIIMKL